MNNYNFEKVFDPFSEIVWKRKKFFLIPALFILIVIGTLFVISEGTTVAPLIYTLF